MYSRIFWYKCFFVLCFEICTPFSAPLPSGVQNFKTKHAQNLSYQNILHRCTLNAFYGDTHLMAFLPLKGFEWYQWRGGCPSMAQEPDATKID